ncbi:MAG: RNA polymerase sigma factor [Bacteroidaceae bacterium]|nr:RNA polymerase sigma factor [Bacteroidaceae bacterium]
MNKENNITMKELAEHFRQEQPHLIRYACYRLGDADDAKDALQDVFLKISAKLSDEKSVEVRDWRNYIFRALSNLCSSRLTASGKLRTIALDARLDLADIPSENNEADYQRIAQLLMEIPEEQAEVIRLRIYGNNSFADVAEILSLPLPTVKSRFLYGLEKIRRAMKQTTH